MTRFGLVALVAGLWGGAALAEVVAQQDIADKYPQSELYNKPVEVIPGVWSAIGATAPPSYENAGHNNNLSFIVTDAGVVVVNGGASVRLAQALHDEIKAVTDQPVTLVIDENGQGHAVLGNAYWRAMGVDVLGQAETVEIVEKEGDALLAVMKGYNRDKAEGTEVAVPNLSFEDEYDASMGGVEIRVLHLGPAHSPGDTQVWLPGRGLVIAGDIAFHERMPPIFADTCTSCWIETFEGPFAALGATWVIPGHGHPTDMASVTEGTVGYLRDLREKIQVHIDEGGDLAGAYYVDQARWAGLNTFEELATKNAGQVFSEMEWE